MSRPFQDRDKSPHSGRRAQALLEFALALPILLLVVYGLMEAGRLMFMYAAVATASREAVRYASAAGFRDPSTYVFTYQDCSGIRARAKQTGFLLNLQDSQIVIYHDNWPTSATPVLYCNNKTQDLSVTLKSGNRVMVNVTSRYTLLLPLVPLTSRTISSGNTARTFMGAIDLIPTPTP